VLNHLSIIRGVFPSLDHITRINPSPRIPRIPLPVHTTPPPPPPTRSPQPPLHTNLIILQPLPLSARTLSSLSRTQPSSFTHSFGFLDIASPNQEGRGQAGGLLAWCFPRSMAWLSRPCFGREGSRGSEALVLINRSCTNR
jgi:hypothetical protein